MYDTLIFKKAEISGHFFFVFLQGIFLGPSSDPGTTCIFIIKRNWRGKRPFSAFLRLPEIRGNDITFSPNDTQISGNLNYYCEERACNAKKINNNGQ